MPKQITQAQRRRRAAIAARNATEHQRKERSRRQVMGPAIIERPLRFVSAQTDTFVVYAKGIALRHTSRYTTMARARAEAGDGIGVRNIARIVLSGAA